MRTPFPLPDLSILIFLVFISAFAEAQTDTIYFNENNLITGEVKEMTRGVLSVKTAYSDSDFKIEWEKVKRFKSDQHFNISLSNRQNIQQVQINTIADGKIAIVGDTGGEIINIEDIVYLRQLKEDFWSKMSAAIDLGYTITKANDQQQFNMRSALGYKSSKWIYSGTYNQVRSTRKDVDPTKRIDAAISANRQLKNGFFIGAQINFLSNTEQLIDLRTTGQLFGGYHISRTNNMYWTGFLGLAFNNENFSKAPNSEMPSTDRKSYEGVIGTEVNLYNIGDFKLLTNITWYPSITEKGRNRVDLRLDISYDLPLDFYIKSGITLNYDNQPTAGASTSDYVFQTGFGWKL